jgi:hypothetical protein
MKPTDTFEKRNRTIISYKEYYAQRYGKPIRDENQPLLRATVKNRDRSTTVVMLIPELCVISG